MTELTDRMRTCAAAIRDRIHDAPMPTEHILDDAAALLEAAATELENPPVVLQPWVPIEAPTPSQPARVAPEKTAPRRSAVSDLSGAGWIDPGVPDLPTQPLSKNVCPKCDSRATKLVAVKDRLIFLHCPACGHTWKR